MGKTKSKKEKYNNMECIVWDLIIGMTLLVKRDYIEKPWHYICVCVCERERENFDNTLLVGVEFKFLKCRW